MKNIMCLVLIFIWFPIFSQVGISWSNTVWEYDQGNEIFRLFFTTTGGHYEWIEVDVDGNETVTFTTNKPIPYCINENPCRIVPGIDLQRPNLEGISIGWFSAGNDKQGGQFTIELIEEDCINCPLKLQWKARNGYWQDGELNVPRECILTQVD